MGFLHVYTGNGKGKTTCAVGLAVRAAGAGLRVAFIQFDKGFDGQNEHYHERHILRKIPGIDVMPFGLERMMPDGKFRFQNVPEDLEEAGKALGRARVAIGISRVGEDDGTGYDVVILDEVITCAGTGLLQEEEINGLVSDFKAGAGCELVMTGRGAWEGLIEAADLVTEMTLHKHYWYSHKVAARPGIDF